MLGSASGLSPPTGGRREQASTEFRGEKQHHLTENNNDVFVQRQKSLLSTLMSFIMKYKADFSRKLKSALKMAKILQELKMTSMSAFFTYTHSCQVSEKEL